MLFNVLVLRVMLLLSLSWSISKWLLVSLLIVLLSLLLLLLLSLYVFYVDVVVVMIVAVVDFGVRPPPQRSYCCCVYGD